MPGTHIPPGGRPAQADVIVANAAAFAPKPAVVVTIAVCQLLGAVVLLATPLWTGSPLEPVSIVAAAVLLAGAVAAFQLSGRTARSRASEPDRLVIDPSRLVLIMGAGTGREWRKADGDLVRVVGRRRGRRLHIGDDKIAIAAGQLRCFDTTAIRAGCIAQGWSWQEAEGPVFAPVPEQHFEPPTAAEPETTVVLRQGGDSLPAGTKYVAGGLFGLWLVCLAAMGLWVILDGSHRVPGWVLPASAPVLLLIAAGYAMLATRGLKVSMVVGRGQIGVRQGNNTTVVKREAVSRITLRGKRIIFHGTTDGRRVLWLSLHDDPAGAAAALRGYDWPLAD